MRILSLATALIVTLPLASVSIWGAQAASERSKKSGRPDSIAPGTKIDLNTASQKELESLPGVGAATARKIIAGRPFKSAADLSRAGVNVKTIEKITPMVTAGAAPPPQSPASARPSAPARMPPPNPAPNSMGTAPVNPAAARPATPPTPASSAPAVTPPSKGMVWATPETKVFHREGDRWYGKTKNGKYMTEQEAIQQGYRETKRTK